MNVKKTAYYTIAFIALNSLKLYAMEGLLDPESQIVEIEVVEDSGKSEEIDNQNNAKVIGGLAEGVNINKDKLDSEESDEDLSRGFLDHKSYTDLDFEDPEVLERQIAREHKWDEVSTYFLQQQNQSDDKNVQLSEEQSGLGDGSKSEDEAQSNIPLVSNTNAPAPAPDNTFEKVVLPSTPTPLPLEEPSRISRALMGMKDKATTLSSTLYGYTLQPYSSKDVEVYIGNKENAAVQYKDAVGFKEKIKSAFHLLHTNIQVNPRKHTIIGNALWYSGLGIVAAGASTVGYKLYVYMHKPTGPFAPLVIAADNAYKISMVNPETFENEFKLMNLMNEQDRKVITAALAALEIHQKHGSLIYDNLILFINAFEEAVKGSEKAVIKIAYTQLLRAVDEANAELKNNAYYNKTAKNLNY